MKILDERQKTHGDFKWNANVSQQIKQIFLSMEHDKLSYVQAEALDMIACKIGRILSGDPNFIDHWQDIAGYAQLVVKDITDKGPAVLGLNQVGAPTPPYETHKELKKRMWDIVEKQNSKITIGLSNTMAGSGYCSHAKPYNDCPWCM